MEPRDIENPIAEADFRHQAKKTPNDDLMNATLKHYDTISTMAHHWSSIVPDAIKQYFNNTLYAFMYNPIIYESEYITVSIHRTREGAEKALICHKNDIKEEWDNEDHIFAFDHFRDWEIEEIQILD